MVNLILIITNNTSGSRELINVYFLDSSTHIIPYPFAFVVPNSPRSFVFVMSSSHHSFAPIKSFDHRNSIADFLVHVFVNSFGNCGVNATSNLAINPVFSSTIPLFSDLLAFGQFLRDNFSILAANALFAFGRDIHLDNLLSAGYLLLLLRLSSSNSKTTEYLDDPPITGCLLPLSLPPPGHSTICEHLLSLCCLLFSLLPSGGNFKLDYFSSPGLFPLLPSFGNFIYN